MRYLAIVFVMLPVVVAVWLLVRAARPSTGDGPARLLAVAVRTLPPSRREWGSAMTAELDHVRSRRDRWRFAFGCVRTAAFPPGADRAMTYFSAAVTLIALAVIWVWVGPTLRVFAMTLAVFIGLLAVGASARRLPSRRTGPGVFIAMPMMFATIACIRAAFDLSHMAGGTISPALSVLFAGAIAAAYWLVVYTPPSLLASLTAKRAGATTAAVLGIGLVVAQTGPLHAPLMAYLIPASVFGCFAVCAVVAAVRRSFRIGVHTALWTVLLGTLAVMTAWLTLARDRYASSFQLLFDGDHGPVGVNLSDAVTWSLILVALGGFSFGVLGAALGGARWWRRAPRRGEAPGLTSTGQ